MQRGRSHDPDFRVTDDNAAAVAAICRRLDGLPLAVELAAAWLRLLPPGELLTHMDRSLPLLTGGARDLPARQRTMRDTVAWSYDLLDATDQRRFRRLAVFAGAWTLDAAAAVVEEDADAVLAGVARLVERSLVVRRASGGADSAPRFGMLETVRAFGVEQLEVCGEHIGTRSTHAGWLLDVAREAEAGLEGPDQARWLSRIADLDDDIHSALAWLRGHDVGAAAELAWSLRWWWYVRAPVDGRRVLSPLLDVAPEGQARARCEATLALVFLAQGELAAAADLTRRAVATATSVGDFQLVTFAWLVAAFVAVPRGEIDVAEQAVAEAGRHGDRLGHPLYPAMIALARVRIAAVAGDLDAAQELLVDSDNALEEVGMPWARILWCNLAVEVAQARGRHDEALALLRRSVELSQQLGDVAALVYALASLAGALVAIGRAEDAGRVFGALEAFGRRHGVVVSDSVAARDVLDERLATLRDTLDAAVLESCWTAGASEPLDATLARVLSGGRRSAGVRIR